MTLSPVQTTILAVPLLVAAALATPAVAAPGEAAVDRAAAAVVRLFGQASCSDLAAMKTKQRDPAMQRKVLDLMKRNPQLRARFINRVAGPIANKMLDCELVP